MGELNIYKPPDPIPRPDNSDSGHYIKGAPVILGTHVGENIFSILLCVTGSLAIRYGDLNLHWEEAEQLRDAIDAGLKTIEGKKFFRVAGDINLGSIDLEAEREEAREHVERMKSEMRRIDRIHQAAAAGKCAVCGVTLEQDYRRPSDSSRMCVCIKDGSHCPLCNLKYVTNL